MMSQNICTLYLVRHAESAVNAGISNPAYHDKYGSSLTQRGQDQAYTLVADLAHIPFAAFYASDKRRAYETAQIMAQGRLVQTSPQLRERLNQNETGEVETSEEAVERLTSILKNIAQAHIGQIVLVVSHGFIMRTLLVALGFATFAELPGGSIPNTGYLILTTEGDQLHLDRVVGVHLISSGKE
jgi:broad specificity phosphatase PhoE